MLRRAFFLILPIILAACSTDCGPLTVKTFVLRDQERDAGGDPWARMEKESRLRGAISMEERRKRLGQYYTILWRDDDVNGGEVTVTLQYQQGKTGSRIKSLTQTFPAYVSEGRASFAVIGNDYLENGRILAWQATLHRGGHKVASRRSYLWQ